ncbi:MAG: DUF3754 domain-containing protein [Hyphomicrobiaceae bacterium]
MKLDANVGTLKGAVPHQTSLGAINPQPATGSPADPFATREKFLPVTKAALMDRLTRPGRWPTESHRDARRFFRYLDYWRQQRYAMRLLGLIEAYEPFSPDTDLLVTRHFEPQERAALQRQVMVGAEKLLQQANYTRIDPAQVNIIVTQDSAYGLDLSVDLAAFEEIAIYYRGVSNRKNSRRTMKKFFRKEEFDVPIFRRLCVIFKLASFEDRVAKVMKDKGCPREEAEKHVKKLRAQLPAEVKEGNVYMKLFRNIPRTDIEMVFPNTQVRFRFMDKIRLGATAGGGLGFGLFTSAGKVALLASNPIGAAGAALGLGGVAFRQAMSFVNQKQRYMVVMAQNLYFLSMADNGSVIVELAARAAEEDIKEEWLLYAILAKTQASRSDLPAIDHAIENFVMDEFGLAVNFDVEDALQRLVASGIVTEDANGAFTTLPPKEAANFIDAQWDILLDRLPDPGHSAGDEATSADGVVG